MLKRVNVTIQNETLSQQNYSLLQYGRNQEVAKDTDCFGKLVSLVFVICHIFALFLDDFYAFATYLASGKAIFDMEFIDISSK